MRALLSLSGYLFAGLAGIAASAYIASMVLEQSFAQENAIEDLAQTDREIRLSQESSKEATSMGESIVLLAQNSETQEPTAPSEEEPSSNQTSLEDDGIVVEGQKKNQFQKLEALKSSFDYNPQGKRDPFAAYEAPRAVIASDKPFGPVQPLQKYSINQLSVKGIIWGVDDPVAMIVTPDDKVHYVREREKIGSNNGYVAQIREGEIVVVESFMFRGSISSQVKILPLMVESSNN